LFGLLVFSVFHRDLLLAFHRATTIGRCLEAPTANSATMACSYTINGISYIQKESGITGWGTYHNGDPVKVWYLPEFPQTSVWGNPNPATNAAGVFVFVLLAQQLLPPLSSSVYEQGKFTILDTLGYKRLLVTKYLASFKRDGVLTKMNVSVAGPFE
jgi:hypothetical protein